MGLAGDGGVVGERIPNQPSYTRHNGNHRCNTDTGDRVDTLFDAFLAEWGFFLP